MPGVAAMSRVYRRAADAKSYFPVMGIAPILPMRAPGRASRHGRDVSGPAKGDERMPVTVKLMENGPLIVNGECELQDAQGNPLPSKGQQFALCRCGASANKPYCDGGHKRIGFKS